MDQSTINIIITVTGGISGWFMRELWTAVKELKSDLAKLREELPHEYVVKNDYRSDVRELKDMLQKLFDRLDGKADK
jgi:adenosylcobinamide amidohydrolase